MEQKPSIGRIVIYNHPGSADGKYLPMQSPAIIQKVVATDAEGIEASCDLFVMSNTSGIFFAKSILRGDGPSQWNWPPKII